MARYNEKQRAYMLEYSRRKQEKKGWIKHKWDIVDDVCLRCGLKRHRKANTKKFGQFIDEYLVNGKWQHGSPSCLAGTKKQSP